MHRSYLQLSSLNGRNCFVENPCLKRKNQLGEMLHAGKGLTEVITVNLCYNDWLRHRIASLVYWLSNNGLQKGFQDEFSRFQISEQGIENRIGLNLICKISVFNNWILNWDCPSIYFRKKKIYIYILFICFYYRIDKDVDSHGSLV